MTLVFEADNEAGGSGGCNSYGTTYTVTGDDITFGETISTRMMCADEDVMTQEGAYFTALAAVTGYDVIDDRLTLTPDDGVTLIFLQIRTLVDTSWQLERISGEAVLDGSEITLMFDDANGIAGSAGCNEYGGSYSASAEDDTIAFSQIAMTERACLQDGVMRQEQVFIDALLTARRYTLLDDQLTITYGDDSEELVFN